MSSKPSPITHFEFAALFRQDKSKSIRVPVYLEITRATGGITFFAEGPPLQGRITHTDIQILKEAVRTEVDRHQRQHSSLTPNCWLGMKVTASPGHLGLSTKPIRGGIDAQGCAWAEQGDGRLIPLPVPTHLSPLDQAAGGSAQRTYIDHTPEREQSATRIQQEIEHLGHQLALNFAEAKVAQTLDAKFSALRALGAISLQDLINLVTEQLDLEDRPSDPAAEKAYTAGYERFRSQLLDQLQ